MVSRCESTPHLTQAVIKEEHEVVITTILNLFLVKVDKKYPSKLYFFQDLNQNTERREGRRNTLATPQVFVQLASFPYIQKAEKFVESAFQSQIIVKMQEAGVRLRSEGDQQSEADKTKVTFETEAERQRFKSKSSNINLSDAHLKQKQKKI